MMQKTGVRQTLAEHLARSSRELKYRRLSSETVHEVKRRLMDTFACALGGWSATPAQIALEAARSLRLRAGATLLGSAWKSTPDLAAFANGTAVRFLDYNDTYLSKEPAHPSDNIPAALAVAEVSGSGGKELIEAILLGYEVQCRLCDAAALRPRGWDHVVYGAFSTALIAAKLWRLSETETCHALGLSGTFNYALRQTRVGELSMWKAAAFANTARNGLFAVSLARLGMTGPAPIFEGEKGMMQIVSGPFDLPPLPPEGPFKILETYIKYYPIEYHAQSAVEAALQLRGQLKDNKRDRIDKVLVRTSEISYEIIGRDPEKWHPKTRETADHSLPYCVAVALLDGEVGLRQFNQERISDPKLRSLMQQIQVTSDPELSATYPESIANTVELRTEGKVYIKRIDHPRGHPKNRMTDTEVEAKFRRLAEPLLSKNQIQRILDRLWNVEKEKSIGDLLALFKIKGRKK
ncbi:MAG: MmgE/PrpD family protein [Nitrospiria bacterium]